MFLYFILFPRYLLFLRNNNKFIACAENKCKWTFFKLYFPQKLAVSLKLDYHKYIYNLIIVLYSIVKYLN